MTKSIRWLWVPLLAAGPALAQPVNLIESRLDAARQGFFELGPLYVTPSFTLQTGYDSNAFSTPDPQSDIMARVGPGVRVSAPIGKAAFFDVFQEIDYVYYREQTVLRNWVDITRVGGGFGGRRVLFQAHDEFRSEVGRPTSEFDFPVEQKLNNLDLSVTFALGWRQELSARFVQNRATINESKLDDPTVAERLNNIRDVGSVDLARKMSTRTSAIFEGFYEKLRFDDATRNSESYGGRFGFDFSAGRRDRGDLSENQRGLNGKLLIGFRTLVPQEAFRVDYAGLIGDVDVSYTWENGYQIRGMYTRDIRPSIFDLNWFFTENRVGAFVRLELHERFYVEPGVIRGDNNYPLPTVREGPEGEPVAEPIVDEHTSYRVRIGYRIRPTWSLGVSADYLERRSNIRLFAKDRLLFNFFVDLRP